MIINEAWTEHVCECIREDAALRTKLKTEIVKVMEEEGWAYMDAFNIALTQMLCDTNKCVTPLVQDALDTLDYYAVADVL